MEHKYTQIACPTEADYKSKAASGGRNLPAVFRAPHVTSRHWRSWPHLGGFAAGHRQLWVVFCLLHQAENGQKLPVTKTSREKSDQLSL